MTLKAATSAKVHAEFEHYYQDEHTPDLTPLTDDDLAAMGIKVEHPKHD